MSRLEQNYLITQKLSKNIYKAQKKILNQSTQKTAIIKKIPFSSIEQKRKKQIVNEVNILLKMKYTHILRYFQYEINKKDVTVDIAMEHCQGGTLQELINKHKAEGKKISEDLVWRIFYQLAQALDYIQKEEVVHRNINPSNIYFKEVQRKNIKLGGFCFAKKIENEDTLASTVLPQTTYLSPEQIQLGICTMQTDIWALGCLIYELCTFHSPFKHSNQFERAKMIKETRPKKTAYSIQLNRLIFWCISKRSEQRPTLTQILSSPEINLRIRERRYLRNQSDLIQKEASLAKREKELEEKERKFKLEQKVKIEPLKKKSSQFSSYSSAYLKKSID